MGSIDFFSEKEGEKYSTEMTTIVELCIRIKTLEERIIVLENKVLVLEGK